LTRRNNPALTLPLLRGGDWNSLVSPLCKGGLRGVNLARRGDWILLFPPFVSRGFSFSKF